MNVLIAPPLFPPYSGTGSTTYFSTLVKEADHEFRILAPYHSAKPLVDRSDGNVIYRVVPRFDPLPHPIRLLLEVTASLFASLFLFLRYDIDVGHTHATSYPAFGVTLSGRLSGTPVVHDCRDEQFPPLLVRLDKGSVWFSCATNIDDKLRRHGIPDDRIVRLPVVNPDYVSEYRNTSSEDSSFRIVYVGLFKPEKGVPLLVEAFDRLSTQYLRAYLILVGDGPQMDQVQREVAQKDLTQKVTITGNLPHRDALEHISQADVLVLPSSVEGRPRVVLEAMEVGTPVVATPVGDIPEIIDDGNSGIIVNRSPEDIRAALEDIYQDPQLRERLASNAQAKSEEWDWQTVTNKLNDGYQRVLS